MGASIDDVYNKISDVANNVQTVHHDLVNENSLITSFRDANHADLSTEINILKIISSEVLNVFAVLKHISKQQEAMICLLDKIESHTCMLLNESHWQTTILTDLRAATNEELLIEKSAFPAAAVEVDRTLETRAEIERCCPPKEPEPICRPSRCPDPGLFKEPPSEHIG